MDNNTPTESKTLETQPEKVEDKFKRQIALQILNAAPHLKEEQAVDLVGRATKKPFDYVVQIARLNRFFKPTEPPQKTAEAWVQKFSTNEWIKSFEAQGPLIMVAINKLILLKEVVQTVLKEGEKYGTTNEGKGETVVVEFSSPNIAKPFHVGHLRSTIIGNYICNLHRALGYNVVGINYLGDWGKQYGLLAVGFSKFGSEEELEKNPIRHLYDVYVKVNKYADENPSVHDEARQLFKKMEEGDAEALKIWEKFRNLSIEEYKKVYARLNVHFDIYSGESQMGNGMEEQIKVLETKGLLQLHEGAQIVDLKAHKLNVALIRKSDGATLYFTRDIAAAVERWEKYHFKKLIYVVASQQNLHFQQLFKVLELMGYDWVKRCSHINFGLVKGMSTRKGTVVFLDEILEEANHHMRKIMEENKEKFEEIDDPDQVADTIGLSAVFIQDMQALRNKDYDFNWERIFKSTGHTGPYLQFAYARLCGVERKSGVEINPSANLDLCVEEEAQDLAMVISRYPEAIQAAAAASEPSTLVTYLFELSHAISVAHNVLWVKNQPKEIAEARLLVYHAARITLGNGMKILSLKPLERM